MPIVNFADEPQTSTTTRLLDGLSSTSPLSNSVSRATNFVEFITSLPLGDTRTFLLDGEFPIQNEWLSLARCTESITELRLYGGMYDEDGMAKMLSLRHGDLSDDGRAPVVLPNLDTLTMDSFYFWLCENEHRPVFDVVSWIAQRTREGAEIKTVRTLRAYGLSLEGCTVCGGE